MSTIRKKRTAVVTAGTIVVDVKKPGRIILRNNIIIIVFIFSLILWKSLREKRMSEKTQNFDRDFYNRQKKNMSDCIQFVDKEATYTT